jgi:glycosyltransferase involved in cell wall biosynthesis
VRDHPAFPPTGDLVSVPSVAIPRRPEYRIPSSLSREVRDDLARFAPNIIHVSSPDVVAHRAVSWARARGIPAVASVHTRFETYLQYYGLSWLEPTVRAILRRFYRRCDAIVAPAESTAAVLHAQRMSRDITIWSRGVDRDQFNPGRRSLEWRARHGIGNEEMVVAFLGRIVMEKGLDVFVEAIAAAVRRGVGLRVLVIGDGPARGWFEANLPKDAIFVGQQTGDDLAVALASADIFLNPSITEAFGNVTQEAMACALPVIAASATGATSLVRDGVTGILVDPLEPDQYGAALKRYADDPELRARHGAAGLDYAKTRDWDTINGVVMKLYERVIERRDRMDALYGKRWLPS